MKKIAICAGHSFGKPGAARGELREEVLMTELRDIVADKLRAKGFEVLTDGDRKQNLSLTEAIKLVRRVDVAVELHTNAVASNLARGVETFALPGHRRLAQRLSAAVAAVLGTVVRGEAGYKPQSESQHGTLGFVSNGGLLLEVFFLSNPVEVAAYQAKKWLVAQAIADVLEAECRAAP